MVPKNARHTAPYLKMGRPIPQRTIVFEGGNTCTHRVTKEITFIRGSSMNPVTAIRRTRRDNRDPEQNERTGECVLCHRRLEQPQSQIRRDYLVDQQPDSWYHMVSQCSATRGARKRARRELCAILELTGDQTWSQIYVNLRQRSDRFWQLALKVRGIRWN